MSTSSRAETSEMHTPCPASAGGGIGVATPQATVMHKTASILSAVQVVGNLHSDGAHLEYAQHLGGKSWLAVLLEPIVASLANVQRLLEQCAGTYPQHVAMSDAQGPPSSSAGSQQPSPATSASQTDPISPEASPRYPVGATTTTHVPRRLQLSTMCLGSLQVAAPRSTRGIPSCSVATDLKPTPLHQPSLLPGPKA